MPSYLTRKRSDKDFYLSQAGRPPRKNAASIYRGVSYAKSNKKWRAALTYKGVRHYLGQYDTEIEAAEAYNKAALRLIGDYALLNEIPQHD
jgi:hypothetical protein